MNAEPVLRFAPSPNGELHLGHAYSALVTADLARGLGGRLLLRIEDIDIGRCRPEFEHLILDDLAWLGLEWERPVRRQSEHFATYREALGRLDARGVLYPCFATRKEIADHIVTTGGGEHPADPDGAPLYPGLHRDLSAGEVAARRARGEPHALRLDMVKALRIADMPDLSFRELPAPGASVRERPADPARWGDVVIARKDVPTSYHLSVVVDDALQSVSHVTRGMDLYAATDLHRLLQVLLGLPDPIYHHHELITDDAGRKLAKSYKDKSLRSLRAEGVTAAEIRGLVGLAP